MHYYFYKSAAIYINMTSLPCGAWWRHHMKTFSTLLDLCAGNSPVTGEFSSQRPVTRSFHLFLSGSQRPRLTCGQPGDRWLPLGRMSGGPYHVATQFYFFIYSWTISWVNNRDTGDLRRHYYDVTVIRGRYLEKLTASLTDADDDYSAAAREADMRKICNVVGFSIIML